jgi:hypothetical protein
MKLAAFFCVAVVGILATVEVMRYNTERNSDEKPWYYNHQLPARNVAPAPVPPPPQPKLLSYSLLPRQTVNVRNVNYRRFLIRSDYPISVRIGDCQADNVVEWKCLGEPADVFIVDDRLKPIFTTPRANVVRIAGLPN